MKSAYKSCLDYDIDYPEPDLDELINEEIQFNNLLNDADEYLDILEDFNTYAIEDDGD